MNKNLSKCLVIFLAMFLVVIGQVQALAEFDANAQQPSKFQWGETKQISINIQCDNSAQSCRCKAYWDNAWSSEFLINPQSSTTRYASVTAPSSSQGSASYNYKVGCNEYWDSTYVYDDAPFTVNYPTDAQWAQYQAELQAKAQAESAKNGASSAISGANSAINSAQSRINEASGIGADISSATQYVNSAQSDYSSANTLLSSGNSAFSSGDYSSATSYYQQAQSKASSAQSSASQAKSQVDSIIEEYNRKKTEAQNKVSDSNSAIDTAKQRIDAGDKVIGDATIIGLDTAQAKADIATARSKIDTAEDYYKEASNLFSTGNFEGAKSKAQSAIDLSNQAENLATIAYNTLNERLTVAGESSKAILNANSEISQMNEILTKMDYIVRSTEKWGVDLTETKSVVTTSKTNVDNAEDLLSQSKNRQSSGSFNDAVNFANQAMDKAASSRNRLDTMTNTISLSTQDALEKAYLGLQVKIQEAESEVKSAQETYGATPNLIVDAQNDLSEAKKSLTESQKQIESVKTASGLIPLLEKADTAFKLLDTTEEKITSAIANAKSAKLGLTKKIAIGAAIATAAGGGGFLYYRSRKKKKQKHEKSEEHKEAKKEEVKESKEEGAKEKIGERNETKEKELKKEKIDKKEEPLKNCPKCNAKLKKGQKFCNECGEKLVKGYE